eukprot:TRINITY_DN30808_c0_g1_i1.p1 TRINITY_DN30808_c0_g1~~TRINITY_DN30808_c0_g1_i1.p1  ORF type:complete len:478 (+),score=91.50 TRINITY_DN30808_c0_g1_i1:56-1489(+)
MRPDQDTLKILQEEFTALEYEKFAIAPSKCKRLVTRCLMIVSELSLGSTPVGAKLSVVLSAGLYLVNYCRGDEGIVERVLMSLTCAPLFCGIYERLAKVWGSHPPSWLSEDTCDEDLDRDHSFNILNERKHEWQQYSSSTTGDLWHLLTSLTEASPDQVAPIRRRILAKYSRQSTIIDTRDFQNVKSLKSTKFHDIRLGHYRGTEVMIKSVAAEYLNANIQQSMLMAAPILVKTIHPNIVPMLGVSVVDDDTVGDNAQPCAITVCAQAPGPSLEELWYTAGSLPTPRSAMVLITYISDALLYLLLGDSDGAINGGLITELPAGNCILDPDTLQPRILLSISSDEKVASRWRPPPVAKSKYCYMVGLLLWAGLTASKPLPYCVDQVAINECVASGSWRPSLGSNIPKVVNDFLQLCCAHESDEYGFESLSELIEELKTLPKIENTIPAGALDDYGVAEVTPHPLRSPASAGKPWPVHI